MKAGQKIVWDYKLGYEIGYYLGEDTNNIYHVKINLITGKLLGEVSMPSNEVKECHENELWVYHAKYGYSHKFPDPTQIDDDIDWNDLSFL